MSCGRDLRVWRRPGPTASGQRRGSVNAFDPAAPLQWTDLDRKAVDTVRVLAADAVEKVGNGHPGTAMSLAPVAYLLYQNRMHLDPGDPQWLGRDRFVLSAGHSSLTQYIQLYLAGYGLELDDIADRKSTRLNSSHANMSYAAFCL